ncbi:flavin-containing monooxygenase [Comamonas endophytica]|uniref:NAD(P)/FAD-dependent oxidoreductase n=1 Tax=Comamonas endophytica TaxID=2949090 RepID=A0ABY6G9S2_9BURK|nr:MULTISPECIES: NAD(P)/FAD-dependent oxidoreductase [unclassified Acidovorax]MCD2511905.1 NAD(P)/FAD-dependent oxidoreductase [Acidovorax sp. D4N7]UYG51623.1 NAD(P)/FAD-dependent oxidoreductase [Acidovorax sp. 5MLIR]
MNSLLSPLTPNLDALQERYRRDLQLLALPARHWTPTITRDGQTVLDVAVVGGGMGGLALTTALRHLGIRAEIFDQSPPGYEGPWATTARMETLRSPKELTGPALGFAALTFRAWFEAQWGDEAWARLDKIPRLQWMDYLRWYRETTGVVLHNGQRVTAVRPRADQTAQLDLVDMQDGDRPYTVLARHVVLATGRDGLGGPWVPEVAHQLPRERWAHSSDRWANDAFAGKTVVVVGGGASAMDSAATALENGATAVHLLIRRKQLPTVNKGKGAGNPGAAHGFARLTDEQKWQVRNYINRQQVPPPQGSTLRVSRHRNAFFHLGTGIEAAQVRADGRLRIDTTQGPIAADFVVFCTGFRPDWQLRPEFAPFAPHVRLWQDRFTPPAGQEDSELNLSPDLGALFEFQEKTPGSCPGLDRIHCFSYPAALSLGTISGDIPQISDGARRLSQGLAGSLYAEDIAHHYAAMERYSEPELEGHEWSDSPLPAYEEVQA